jgi:transposase
MGVNHDVAYKRKMNARVYADPEARRVLHEAQRQIYRGLRQQGVHWSEACGRSGGLAAAVARKYLVNRHIQT